jgi:hypothetical protein
MTLIVGLMSPKRAILVSDRRLSRNGSLYDDETNKATALFCADGRVAVAFTGLAIAGKFQTSRVLLRLLAEAGKPDNLLLPTIQRFAVLMTEELKSLRIPAKDKHLRIIFAGYQYQQSTAAPMLIQVANAADSAGVIQAVAGEKFLIWTARDPLGIGSFGFGTTSGVRPADRAKLKQLLAEDRPAEALVDKAVDTIRNAADSLRSKNAVGKQCMSIVVPLQGGLVANYHSAEAKNMMYQPSIVVSTPTMSLTSEGGSIEQLDPSTPRPLVVPKTGRNQRCPCGSGLKYKKCCGRTPMLKIP